MQPATYWCGPVYKTFSIEAAKASISSTQFNGKKVGEKTIYVLYEVPFSTTMLQWLVLVHISVLKLYDYKKMTAATNTGSLLSGFLGTLQL